MSISTLNTSSNKPNCDPIGNSCSAPSLAAVLSVMMLMLATSISHLFLASAAFASDEQSSHLKTVGPFEHRNIPGGIAIVSTGITADVIEPDIRWNKRYVAAMENNGEWLAIIGIPLGTDPGEKTIEVTSEGNTRSITFNVM